MSEPIPEITCSSTHSGNSSCTSGDQRCHYHSNCGKNLIPICLSFFSLGGYTGDPHQEADASAVQNLPLCVDVRQVLIPDLLPALSRSTSLCLSTGLVTLTTSCMLWFISKHPFPGDWCVESGLIAAAAAKIWYQAQDYETQKPAADSGCHATSCDKSIKRDQLAQDPYNTTADSQP